MYVHCDPASMNLSKPRGEILAQHGHGHASIVTAGRRRACRAEEVECARPTREMDAFKQ